MTTMIPDNPTTGNSHFYKARPVKRMRETKRAESLEWSTLYSIVDTLGGAA